MAKMGKQKVVIRLRKKKFFDKKKERDFLNFFFGDTFLTPKASLSQLHYYAFQLSNFDRKFLCYLDRFFQTFHSKNTRGKSMKRAEIY